MGRRDLRRKRKKTREEMDLRQAEGLERARIREAQRRFDELHGDPKDYLFCRRPELAAIMDDEDGDYDDGLAGQKSL